MPIDRGFECSRTGEDRVCWVDRNMAEVDRVLEQIQNLQGEIPESSETGKWLAVLSSQEWRRDRVREIKSQIMERGACSTNCPYYGKLRTL